MKQKYFKLVTILCTVFSLTACQGQNRSSFSINSNYASIIQNEYKVNQLRNPDELSHTVDYNVTSDLNYKAFKEKIRVFSSKISDSFIKSDYSDSTNITISPLSIELCLGLAVCCANGDTRAEILKALDVDFATFNQYYKVFYNELTSEIINDAGDLESQVLLTNSIWIDDDVKLLDSGLDALKNDYYCHSFDADFGANNALTVEAMKYFVEQKTKGLISPDFQFNVNTFFVLMNTLYLKDIWKDGGDDLSTTKDYKFTNANKSVSENPLLVGNYVMGRAYKTDDYSSFYTVTRHGYHIYFVKPHGDKALKDVFNQKAMLEVLDNKSYVLKDDKELARYHTRCIFPEFKADCDIDLIKMFKNDFNVKLMFDDATCDFSNITTEDGFIEQFEHIAKLEVNKTGIEGAAVTYMSYATKAGPDEYKDIYDNFIVDQEFGFILTTYDGDVLFSGAVTNID